MSMELDIQKILNLGIDQIRDMATEKTIDIIDAFGQHGVDEWFTVTMNVKVRKITRTSAEVVPRISFSRGKVTGQTAFVYDSEQMGLPGIPK